MHRRHYLAATGIALTTAVAGCSSPDGDGNEDGTPTPRETTDGTPTPDGDTDGSSSSDEGESVSALRAELEDRDVDIYDLFRDGPYVILDYFTRAEDENDEALDEEIVAISRAFAEVVEDFDEGLERMECLALLDEETYVDVFDVQAEWARDYAAGDLSDEEYTQNVIGTLEYR